MTPDELAELRRFADEVEEYERVNRDPAREQAEDAEYAKLAALYPGEFVAFQDAWDGAALTRRVLAHAPTHREVSDALVHLTDDERCAIEMTYIDPPNLALCTRLRRGEIGTAATAPRPGG